MQIFFTAASSVAGLACGAIAARTADRFYPDGPVPPVPHNRRRLRTPLLAAASALLFAAASQRATGVTQFLLMCLFGLGLLLLATTDFERHLLPNRIMYPCLVAAVLLSWAWPHRSPLSGLAGGVIGTAVMLMIFLVLPGFGFGDVKLAGLMGLILGFPTILTGLLVGMVLGGCGAAWLVLSKRAGLRTAMAYGPYLAGGAILEMLIRR
jgi:leader peptidase (prepilin peptidase)/N-methyltransferase